MVNIIFKCLTASTEDYKVATNTLLSSPLQVPSLVTVEELRAPINWLASLELSLSQKKSNTALEPIGTEARKIDSNQYHFQVPPN